MPGARITGSEKNFNSQMRWILVNCSPNICFGVKPLFVCCQLKGLSVRNAGHEPRTIDGVYFIGRDATSPFHAVSTPGSQGQHVNGNSKHAADFLS